MTTIVEDILIFGKLMDSEAPTDWPETDKATAERMLSNLRYYRDGWANGQWYVAVGYDRVVWHDRKKDRWFVHPRFASNVSREP